MFVTVLYHNVYHIQSHFIFLFLVADEEKNLAVVVEHEMKQTVVELPGLTWVSTSPYSP